MENFLRGFEKRASVVGRFARGGQIRFLHPSFGGLAKKTVAGGKKSLDKQANAEQGVQSGLFSRDGIAQAVKNNPLPSANLKPMGAPKRVSGHGAGSMPVP